MPMLNTSRIRHASHNNNTHFVFRMTNAYKKVLEVQKKRTNYYSNRLYKLPGKNVVGRVKNKNILTVAIKVETDNRHFSNIFSRIITLNIVFESLSSGDEHI